ncbi:thiamine phosphate synthase [Colwellia sp. 4_MG-2023]|uniref:thiamine phosphate synthase n=1 Tax=unclassified Colwellia TaxID=196834 RepID=UPI001C0822FC|nr:MULTISPECIES: thiamine phosphate synthase [unclassified Colwellia]MBU2923743.1 thiamine phosphate synthase [Colwellia sp. C2M11]MDO6505734.1 thiamine phosphate synthase [Colwellia sp. 5_MG-2023]MDO6554415.1 thiamine phosphate synthase [Colwellia sp. 4_MG-2023]MDO6652157.1 thiamine phosphate synthase [Colwellia sp. 3_MG-2023]MDO6664674.1 thiamine phosphate synthase [Colwellia sp. 2_MG-2023]
MINNRQKKPIIWSISGSDCSGGAGIAADIKTGHSLGVEVCTLITANTVQNSDQLISVNPVAVDILQQQVTTLIEDKPPAVIKIGLLAGNIQVLWLASTLKQLKRKLPQLITVYDPVGQASVGGNFNQLSVLDLAPLLQQIDVLTPNINEAHFFVSSMIKKEIDSLSIAQPNISQLSVKQLAKIIHQRFAIKSIIIKGGHSKNNHQCIDYCYHQLNQIKQDNQDKCFQAIEYQLSSPRLKTHYSHGGGCSFASALASCLAKGYLVRDAFTLAKAFINHGLAATQSISAKQQHQYYGAFEQLAWPAILPSEVESQVCLNELFPTVIDTLNQQHQNLPAFASLNLQGEKLGLYPVVDSIAWLKRLLPLGLNIIQLRVKNLAETELKNIIIEAINLAQKYKTRLFINDYWELAIKYNAYGVHIGQEDLNKADLKKIQQAGLKLGISTHGCYEFLLAQQLQPSYLAIGAIFPTKTKDMTGQIQGVDNLRQLLALRSKKPSIPVVAIGGINLARAPQVLATTVDSIAVVTAITEASNPEQAVTEFVALTKHPKLNSDSL